MGKYGDNTYHVYKCRNLGVGFLGKVVVQWC